MLSYIRTRTEETKRCYNIAHEIYSFCQQQIHFFLYEYIPPNYGLKAINYYYSFHQLKIDRPHEWAEYSQFNQILVVYTRTLHPHIHIKYISHFMTH